MIYRILTIALFSSLFVTISAFCGVEYVRTQPVEKSSSAAYHVAADSLSPFLKYEENLTTLINDFEEMGFDIDELMKDPRFEIYEEIDDRFIKSAERKSRGLDEYKQILGFERKSAQIVDFINTHYEQLEKAEETYGISKFVISAIIGVETAFGEYIGEYNPFNAYVSMYAVDYRSDFAKAQLKHLMIFTRKNDLDVLSLKSSYAGAMSYAQFIPYSLNKWFVGNELYNMDNNILSVANYLSYFKERTGDIETAVLRYNPSDLYRDAVLDLAKAGKKNFLASS